MRNPLLRFSLLLVAFAFLTACDDTTDRLSQLSGPTMGTSWSVKFTGTPENGVPALKSAIESSLEDINQEMSTYLPDSAISRFNGLESGRTRNASSRRRRKTSRRPASGSAGTS